MPRSTSPAKTRGKKPMAAYLAKHKGLEAALADALKAAVDADAAAPLDHISRTLLNKPAEEDGESASGYGSLSFIDIARQRGGWLFLFLGGLLLCASVMHSFEALLEAELELAFFVPLLIGHGGNSGGQTTSTVIRALGSGSVKLSDASRVIAKEGAAGVLQSIFLALALFPCLRYGMGISERVCVVVGLTMPCLGGFANTLGATLPFLATWIGMDPAIICGPLTTTSVDTCGLMTYLTIATTYLKISLGGK